MALEESSHNSVLMDQALTEQEEETLRQKKESFYRNAIKRRHWKLRNALKKYILIKIFYMR